MSDDQHVERVSYADSDGELPNKESVISNGRMSYGFQPSKAEEKEQLQGNNFEAITQLTQNIAEEEKLHEQPEQNAHAETTQNQITHLENEEVNNENQENQHAVDQKEEQVIAKVQEIQEQHVEQIKTIANDLINNEEVKESQPLDQDVPLDIQQLRGGQNDSQSQKEESIENLDQVRKQVDQQPSQQVVQNQSSLTNKIQRLDDQTQNQGETINEREFEQISNQVAEIIQEKPLQQEKNNQAKPILDKVLNENESEMIMAEERIAQLQEDLQQPKENVQIKNQVEPTKVQEQIIQNKIIQQQKNDVPVKAQNVISNMQPLEVQKPEKVEYRENQDDLSLSEQKVEHRETKKHNELVPKGANARSNNPPRVQQSAGQSAKSCTCEIM